ncbi:MAG TPA: SpvB/TcaC N-terminal domain-containing protein, partial [Ignavibacteriaceae bacterium]|nr:SpvB/TcaC N-terminal domain-containing protein [Ignavibacteriaceae bacterium]
MKNSIYPPSVKQRIRTLSAFILTLSFILISNYSRAQRIKPLVMCAVTSISPTTINAGRYGGQYTVNVSTINNCSTYTVSESLTWVSYTKSGMVVTINISANTGNARSGDVIIGGQTLTINQACGNYAGNAGAISGSNSVCKGQTGVAYSVPTISGATSYVWTLPSGASIASGANTNSITVNYSSSASSGTISVYGTNSCHSGNSSSLSVTVNSLPTPSASSNTPACSGGTITLSASGGSTYHWTGPNSFSSSSASPSISNVTANNAGYYYVTVTSSAGCSAQTRTYVVVNSPITATISGGTTPICYNTSAGTLTVEPSGGTGSYSYLWYKNGSVTGVTSQSYSIGTLTSTSTFYCRVSSGSCTPFSTTPKTIEVHGDLTATLTGGTTPICYNTSPGTLTATGHGGTGSYTYSWYKNGNPVNVYSRSYSPGPLTSNSQFYCAVTSGSCGTANTTIKTITVNTLPSPSASSNSPVCTGGTINLLASGGSMYSWTGPNSFTSNIASPSISGVTTNNGGDYYVTVTSSAGCSAQTSTHVTVNNPITASISGGTSPICYNTSPGIITATASGGTGSFTYLWYKNGTSTNVTTSSFSPGLLQSDAIIYCRVSSGSCTPVNSSPITIYVYDELSVSISGGATEVCNNTSPGILTAQAVGGIGYNYSYLWYKDGNSTDVTSNTYDPGPLTSTTSVYCRVTSGSCNPISSDPVTITILPSTTIQYQPHDDIISPDESATFTVTASGPNINYEWQYSITGSDPWTVISNSNSNSINITDIYSPKSYRCKITSNCQTLYTNSVKVIVTADYLTGNDIPDINRSLETSLSVVGTSAMQTSVNQMGAANINVPIFTPPGTNGMSPSISITYNSQSGNGILGYGWHINGLSDISRTGKSMMNDNEVTGVTFSLADRFILDGERLVLDNGTYGADNSVYFQEMNPFSKIIAHGATGYGPMYFTEETKGGITNEYGNSSNSKLIPVALTSTYSWLINKTEDKNG